MHEAERKVEAVNLYHSDAVSTQEEWSHWPHLTTNDRRQLHRALLRCQGFWGWITGSSSRSDDDGVSEAAVGMDELNIDDETHSREPRKLPSVNFLDLGNDDFVDTIIEEVYVKDQPRFRGYASNRPVGVGLVSAPPGTGKTTIAAIATVATVKSTGRTLQTAGSNVAVSNLCERTYNVSVSITDRYNRRRGKREPESYLLVVRVFKPDDEKAAFWKILSTRETNDGVKASSFQLTRSPFQLHLSRAHWLLTLLGSDTVPHLRPEDSKALHEMKAKLRNIPELALLFALAQRKMTIEEFDALPGARSKVKIGSLLDQILDKADVVGMTPALSQNDEHCLKWKLKKMRALVADEAGNMHRGDLACVWGNTLVPCFLVGDWRQLKPTVMTISDADEDKNLFNRLQNDGRISPLEMLEGSGIPTFELHIQHRMPPSLFDTVAKEIYGIDNPRYSPHCAVHQPKNKIGRELEEFVQRKFPGDLAELPKDRLAPIFIHCEGSGVFRAPETMSRCCPDQVKVALDLIVDFVKSRESPDERAAVASQITVLCPYRPNVDLVEKLRKREGFEELKPMPPANTIDGYQGKENDVTVIVMGTSSASGAGFTAQSNRLNVLLTRSRCGLVVVGDINATDRRRAVEGEDEETEEGRKMRKAIDYGPDGEPHFMSTKKMEKIFKAYKEAKRVSTFVVREKANKKKGEGEEKAEDKKSAEGQGAAVSAGGEGAGCRIPKKRKGVRGGGGRNKKKRRINAAGEEEKEPPEVPSAKPS